MNLFTLPPQKVVMVLLVVLLTAAVFDVRYRRIPNWLTVSGVRAGHRHEYPDRYAGGRDRVLPCRAGGRLSAIYVVLYALRAMGAGDVKLMAAVGAIVGWENWFGIFLVTAIIGGIMALILVVVARAAQEDPLQCGLHPQRNEERASRLPGE